MDIITLTPDNLGKEHICCAISDAKNDPRCASKKAWLAQRMAEGLVFKKMDARGKAFIEYMPAEAAWCPLDAPGYLYIHCFWVSGALAGHGYAGQLLEAAIADAKEKGKLGLCVLSSAKKMPFLSDPKYLQHKGFLPADKAAPFFELLYLPLAEGAPLPQFKPCCKFGESADKGWVLYYTNQCPHTEMYAPLLAEVASKHGQAVTLRKIESTAQAQAAPSPFTTYALFHDGKFVTNEILSEKKFEKMLAESD